MTTKFVVKLIWSISLNDLNSFINEYIEKNQWSTTPEISPVTMDRDRAIVHVSGYIYE